MRAPQKTASGSTGNDISGQAGEAPAWPLSLCVTLSTDHLTPTDRLFLAAVSGRPSGERDAADWVIPARNGFILRPTDWSYAVNWLRQHGFSEALCHLVDMVVLETGVAMIHFCQGGW